MYASMQSGLCLFHQTFDPKLVQEKWPLTGVTITFSRRFVRVTGVSIGLGDKCIMGLLSRNLGSLYQYILHKSKSLHKSSL